MEQLDQNTILINDCMLCTHMPNQLTIVIPKRDVHILRGIVYTAYGERCAGVVVEAIQLSEKDCNRVVLGYTITDNEGEYVIALKTKLYDIYELKAYMPLYL